MVVLGNVATAAEDFSEALELYARVLALVPNQPDALLGTARSLSYLNRHIEAIAAADLLVGMGRHLGDARYWRAFNLVHLSRYDEAWTDIERAATLIVNVDPAEAGGIIAVNRGEFDVARRNLEEAKSRRASDCAVGFICRRRSPCSTRGRKPPRPPGKQASVSMTTSRSSEMKLPRYRRQGWPTNGKGD